MIAKVGLDRLSAGRHAVGLQALLDASGLGGRQVGSEDVTFRVAPRINAAGRMSTPELATQLLLATDPATADQARQLAEDLDAENTRRREEEAATVAAAEQAIERDPALGAQHALVVWAEGWHRGVIGIVASKLVERFARPVIVLSVDGPVAHGSGRSIPGFDLLGALEQCADVLARFGGHRHAAGLVVETARLGRLPVPNFAAVGVATPADAALVMALGAEAVFVGSGIFKSESPARTAAAIVKATAGWRDGDVLIEACRESGAAMAGIALDEIPEAARLQNRGW